MRIRITAFPGAILLTMAVASLATFASGQQWTLPPSQPVKDAGPRVYRFTSNTPPPAPKATSCAGSG